MIFAIPSRVRQPFIVWHRLLLLVSWSKFEGNLHRRIGKTYVSLPGIAGGLLNTIIDDLQGCKCAASLNIPVRGTLGIVLAAKQRGIIPAARPVIEDMMTAGLYLSKKVLDQALAKVDE